MDVKPRFGWARNSPCVGPITNSTATSSSSQNRDVQHFPIFICPSLIQNEKGKHLLQLNVDNLKKQNSNSQAKRLICIHVYQNHHTFTAQLAGRSEIWSLICNFQCDPDKCSQIFGTSVCGFKFLEVFACANFGFDCSATRPFVTRSPEWRSGLNSWLSFWLYFCC